MANSAVDAWVDGVEDYWIRHGMPFRQRRRLVAELQADLEAAICEGARVDELLGRDVAAFGRELAEAEGTVLARDDRHALPTSDDLARTATAGAFLGAAAAWVWLTSHFLIAPALPDAAALAVIYLVASTLVVTGGFAAVRWRYRWWDGAVRASKVGGAAAVGGLVASIVPIAVLAVLLGYSTGLPSLMLFGASGAGICFVVSRVLFQRFSPHVGA